MGTSISRPANDTYVAGRVACPPRPPRAAPFDSTAAKAIGSAAALSAAAAKEFATLADEPITDRVISAVQNYFRAFGITLKHEPHFESGLALLAIDRFCYMPDVQLHRELNGAVVDMFNGFKVLLKHDDISTSPAAIDYALEHIDNYNVHRAVDGTLVALYFAERCGRWKMSTTGAFDAARYMWIGPKTYEQVFAEAAGAVNPELVSREGDRAPQFRWELLDKKAIYTVIFRHSDFHPLAADRDGLWVVSGPDIPGVPRQSPLEAAPTPVALMESVNDALTAYFGSGGKEINYGYILRAREDFVATASANGAGVVFIESALHRAVRVHVYDLPKNGDYGIPEKYERTWMASRSLYLRTWLSLRAYLSFNRRSEHIALFPAAADLYKKFDFITARLSKRIPAIMRAAAKSMDGDDAGNKKQEYTTTPQELAMGPKPIGVKLFGSAFDGIDREIEAVALIVARELSANRQMSTFSPHAISIIKDQLMNIANIGLYMRIMMADR